MTMATQDTWPSLEDLLREESKIVLPTLTERVAYDLGRRATDAAWDEGLTVVVGIWRGDHQLFHAALPSSTHDNDGWLQRKGRTVRRFEHSSVYMGQLCRDKETTLSEKVLLPASESAAHGGAVPLRVGSWRRWLHECVRVAQLDENRFVVRIVREYLTASRDS